MKRVKVFSNCPSLGPLDVLKLVPEVEECEGLGSRRWFLYRKPFGEVIIGKIVVES